MSFTARQEEHLRRWWMLAGAWGVIGLIAIAVLWLLSGCTVVRDGSSAVFITGTNSISGDIAQRGEATLPSHPWATAIIIIALIAVVTAVVWLVHNRGKLIGLAAKVTTGV